MCEVCGYGKIPVAHTTDGRVVYQCPACQRYFYLEVVHLAEEFVEEYCLLIGEEVN